MMALDESPADERALCLGRNETALDKGAIDSLLCCWDNHRIGQHRFASQIGKEPAPVKRSETIHQCIQQYWKIPRKCIYCCETCCKENIPEQWANRSIPAACQQVEQQGKEILNIFMLEAHDDALEFLCSIGRACCIFIEPLCL